VFASAGVLYRVQAAGGQPAQITTLNPSLQEAEHLAPNFLPDGRHFVYLAVSTQAANSAVYLGSIDSKESKRLFASEAPAIYAAPGYPLFNRGNAVFAQDFDLRCKHLQIER
jgi:Tol biopolymer transport system component